MWRLTLTTRLTLIVVLLSTLITTSVAMALSYIVFIQTENQIRDLLIEKTTHIVEDFLVLDNDQIQPKERPEGESLAGELRNYDLSLYIADKELNPLARYGIYRNLDVEQMQLFVNEETTNRLATLSIGSYADIEAASIGAYDTYTIPLIHQSTLIGFAQVAKPNDVLPLLKNSLKIGLLILLPLVWIVSLVAAGLSTRMALSPFHKLVSYMGKVNVNNPTQMIAIPLGLDYETSVLTRSFNGMMERVKKTLQRQRLLTENISHEFKTPLTQIATKIQVLADSMPKSVQKKITNIEKDVVDLGTKVDALLNLSLGDFAHNNTTAEKPWKLRKLLKELTTDKPQTLQMRIDMPYTFRLSMPISHAHILFSNLLQNAFKYTPRNGSVTISSHTTKEEWFINIENTTQSPISRIEKVFHRRYRDGENNAHKGHGIGLAIVREICNSHNITIEMENTQKKSIRILLKGRLSI